MAPPLLWTLCWILWKQDIGKSGGQWWIKTKNRFQGGEGRRSVLIILSPSSLAYISIDISVHPYFDAWLENTSLSLSLYLGDICGISLGYLWDILDVSWGYLRHVFWISASWAYLGDILGCLDDILGISWGDLEHIFGISGGGWGNFRQLMWTFGNSGGLFVTYGDFWQLMATYSKLWYEYEVRSWYQSWMKVKVVKRC